MTILESVDEFIRKDSHYLVHYLWHIHWQAIGVAVLAALAAGWKKVSRYFSS
jgi:hypothetical protein